MNKVIKVNRQFFKIASLCLVLGQTIRVYACPTIQDVTTPDTRSMMCETLRTQFQALDNPNQADRVELEVTRGQIASCGLVAEIYREYEQRTPTQDFQDVCLSKLETLNIAAMSQAVFRETVNHATGVDVHLTQEDYGSQKILEYLGTCHNAVIPDTSNGSPQLCDVTTGTTLGGDDQNQSVFSLLAQFTVGNMVIPQGNCRPCVRQSFTSLYSLGGQSAVQDMALTLANAGILPERRAQELVRVRDPGNLAEALGRNMREEMLDRLAEKSAQKSMLKLSSVMEKISVLQGRAPYMTNLSADMRAQLSSDRLLNGCMSKDDWSSQLRRKCGSAGGLSSDDTKERLREVFGYLGIKGQNEVNGDLGLTSYFDTFQGRITTHTSFASDGTPREVSRSCMVDYNTLGMRYSGAEDLMSAMFNMFFKSSSGAEGRTLALNSDAIFSNMMADLGDQAFSSQEGTTGIIAEYISRVIVLDDEPSTEPAKTIYRSFRLGVNEGGVGVEARSYFHSLGLGEINGESVNMNNLSELIEDSDGDVGQVQRNIKMSLLTEFSNFVNMHPEIAGRLGSNGYQDIALIGSFLNDPASGADNFMDYATFNNLSSIAARDTAFVNDVLQPLADQCRNLREEITNAVCLPQDQSSFAKFSEEDITVVAQSMRRGVTNVESPISSMMLGTSIAGELCVQQSYGHLNETTLLNNILTEIPISNTSDLMRDVEAEAYGEGHGNINALEQFASLGLSCEGDMLQMVQASAACSSGSEDACQRSSRLVRSTSVRSAIHSNSKIATNSMISAGRISSSSTSTPERSPSSVTTSNTTGSNQLVTTPGDASGASGNNNYSSAISAVPPTSDQRAQIARGYPGAFSSEQIDSMNTQTAQKLIDVANSGDTAEVETVSRQVRSEQAQKARELGEEQEGTMDQRLRNLEGRITDLDNDLNDVTRERDELQRQLRTRAPAAVASLPSSITTSTSTSLTPSTQSLAQTPADSFEEVRRRVSTSVSGRNAISAPEGFTAPEILAANDNVELVLTRENVQTSVGDIIADVQQRVARGDTGIFGRYVLSRENGELQFAVILDDGSRVPVDISSLSQQERQRLGEIVDSIEFRTILLEQKEEELRNLRLQRQEIVSYQQLVLMSHGLDALAEQRASE